MICGIVSQSGPNGEPLGCGYQTGHEGNHSWATLPTFPGLQDRDEELDTADAEGYSRGRADAELEFQMQQREIKAELILMRRYILSHDLMIGECTAWARLKRLFGIGFDHDEDEKWLANYEAQKEQAARHALTGE